METNQKTMKILLFAVSGLLCKMSVMASDTPSTEYSSDSNAIESADFSSDSDENLFSDTQIDGATTDSQKTAIGEEPALEDGLYTDFSTETDLSPYEDLDSDYEDLDFETSHEHVDDENQFNFTPESYEYESQEYIEYPEDEFEFDNYQPETMYQSESIQPEEEI